MERSRFDGLTIAALAFLVFIAFNVLKDQGLFSDWFSSPNPPAVRAAPPILKGTAAATPLADLTAEQADSIPAKKPKAEAAGSTPAPVAPTATAPYDPNVIIWPYLKFVVTQGPHDQAYGQLAVDIFAGKGTSIMSPITGSVTGVFIDQYNNTNLVIENERWKVLMLHGNYTVSVGQWVTIGQPVGTESNNGYTVDQFGRLCAGRDCGYHTHINVFDKQLGTNINPLEVLKTAPPPPPSGS